MNIIKGTKEEVARERSFAGAGTGIDPSKGG